MGIQLKLASPGARRSCKGVQFKRSSDVTTAGRGAFHQKHVLKETKHAPPGAIHRDRHLFCTQTCNRHVYLAVPTLLTHSKNPVQKKHPVLNLVSSAQANCYKVEQAIDQGCQTYNTITSYCTHAKPNFSNKKKTHQSKENVNKNLMTFICSLLI